MASLELGLDPPGAGAGTKFGAFGSRLLCDAGTTSFWSHILVWCLRLHLQQGRLDLHVATWWLPRQLKHNCFCMIIFLRSCAVFTFVQLLVKWWSLQNAHLGVRSVGRLSLVVGSLQALLGFEPVPVKKEAVAGCISGVLTQEYQFPFSMPVFDLVIAIYCCHGHGSCYA